MPEFERPGIYPQWDKAWKVVKKNKLSTIDMHWLKNIREIESYLENGITDSQVEFRKKYPAEVVNPIRLHWETTGIDQCLALYGSMELSKAEIASLEGDSEYSKLFSSTFVVNYTRLLMHLYLQTQNPKRYNGRILAGILNTIPYTALGFVIGCDEQASRLAKLQLSAYRRGFYQSQDHYPIFHFMLRIMADYLGEPDIVLTGDSLKDPIFQALFLLWREPDPQALVKVGLAACDFHTHRCRTDSFSKPKDARYYEFNNRSWTRWPIEILLLFKLRERLGLPNPVLDHPLMNRPLGVLPPECPFEPDDLIRQVRERLINDGYDEQAIFELCYV